MFTVVPTGSVDYVKITQCKCGYHDDISPHPSPKTFRDCEGIIKDNQWRSFHLQVVF